jgi:hypothetical protein
LYLPTYEQLCVTLSAFTKAFSDFVFKKNIYTHLILVFCGVYAVFYDKLKNSYISHIFQQDKYGIVIVYCCVNVLSLCDAASDVIQDVFVFLGTIDSRMLPLFAQMQEKNYSICQMDARERTAYVLRNQEFYIDMRGGSLTGELFTEGLEYDYVAILSRARSMILLTTAKALLFNYIFSNHTSDQKTHQRVHILCVVSLGVISIWSHILVEYWAPSDWLLILGVNKIINMLVYGILFQLAGWHTDRLRKLNQRSRLWNALTWIFEALLIEQTISC